MKLKGKIFGCMILVAFFCVLARPAAAVTQDFESQANGTALSSLSGWQAPPDHIIRTTSLITTSTGGTPYANVGFTNRGVEAYFENQSNAFPTNAVQTGALWTLPSTNALSQNGGVFQIDVRLSSWTNVTGVTTNVVNDPDTFNGFWMVAGSGFQYETSNSRVVYSNAQAFAVCFVDNDQGDKLIYWEQPDFDNSVNGTPGFSTSLNSGTGLNGAGYIHNWNRRIIMPWVRDTYYTIQLSNITFNSSICTQATAVLSIWETANPANILTNNLIVRAHAGNAALMATPFTNINQIAVAVARKGAFDHYDNIILAQPQSPIVSTTVLQITSIARQGNDINLTWMTGTAGGQTNAVQVTSGDANGNYATNGFADLATLVIPGSGIVVTNYVDVGGGTNKPSRYYRIRLVP